MSRKCWKIYVDFSHGMRAMILATGWVMQTRSWVLVLVLPSCVTLGNLFNLLSLSFDICKIGLVIITVSEGYWCKCIDLCKGAGILKYLLILAYYCYYCHHKSLFPGKQKFLVEFFAEHFPVNICELISLIRVLLMRLLCGLFKIQNSTGSGPKSVILCWSLQNVVS